MLNLSLYVILDTAIASDRTLLKIAQSAITGGATMIQLRDKRFSNVIPTEVEGSRDSSTRPHGLARNDKLGELVRFGKVLHKITSKARIPLIINDYVDVALAIGADGVHLGQDDISIRNKELGIRNYGGKNHNSLFIIRNSIGPKKIIGVSVKTVTQAKKAEKDGADYLGVGSIYTTESKADAGKPIGLGVLRSIVAAVSIPVVAIGGINAKNAKDVMRTGVSGVAVISAVMEAKDPERATRELYEQIRSTKHEIRNNIK